MNIKEAWIKAAIESVTLEIDYYSDRTKKEYSTREVEPDYYGWGLNIKKTMGFGARAQVQHRNQHAREKRGSTRPKGIQI